MSEKAKCVLAYIFGWIGGLVILYAAKNNERNTRFHAAQSIVLSVAYFIITVIINLIPFDIPFVGTAIYVVYIIGVIMGIVKACKNQDPELPVVGGLAKSIFGKKIEG